MNRSDTSLHLKDMDTSWTLIHEAHVRDEPEVARAAQEAFFLRYQGPIRRYIRAVVRDEAQAEELHARFFEKFVAGRFHTADPGKGRFRDYLRSALFHLVSDHRQGRRREPGPLVIDVPARAPHEVDSAEDALFKKCYRDGLIQRTWRHLEERESREGRPYATILRQVLKEPPPTAAEIARSLSQRSGRKLTEDWVRAVRKKARDTFKEFLLQQVRESLRYPTDTLIEDELIDIGLHHHLKSTLHRQRNSA